MKRSVVFVRHGQRVDKTHGDDWTSVYFNKDGQYDRKDNQNMPYTVPIREKPESFYKDPPLTPTGTVQGTRLGIGIRKEQLLRPGFQMYVSPALRCVETATAITKGMGLTGDSKVDFKVEPGLMEWRGWRYPKLLNETELIANGFQVDTTYSELVKKSEILPEETIPEFYERTRRVMNHLLAQNDNDILVIGHAATMDATTRPREEFPVGTLNECLGVMREAVRDFPVGSIGIVAYCKQDKAAFTNTWTISSVSSTSDSILKRYSSASDFSAFNS